MVLGDNFKTRRLLFERYGIVQTAYLDFAKKRLLATPPGFYQGLRQRVLLAREDFLVTKHAPRLARFYFSVANTKNEKTFQNSSSLQSTSDSTPFVSREWNQERFEKILKAKEITTGSLSIENKQPGALSNSEGITKGWQ